VDSDLEAAATAADVVDEDDAILPEPLTPPRVAALAMAERRRNMAVVGGSGPLLVPLVYVVSVVP
jgi:hypothetical protein